MKTTRNPTKRGNNLLFIEGWEQGKEQNEMLDKESFSQVIITVALQCVDAGSDETHPLKTRSETSANPVHHTEDNE